MFDHKERGFIREILTDPQSLEPRARYADWLSVQEDERAEAVHLGTQIRECERDLFDGVLEVDHRLLDLRSRLKEPLAWRKHLPRVPGVEWRKAEGGLIEQVGVRDVGAFRRQAGAILDVQPVHRLEWNGKDVDSYLELLASRELSRLGGLFLGGNYNGPAVAHAVAASAHLTSLKVLNVSFSSIGDGGAAQLAEAEHLSGLRELTLVRNDLTNVGLKALCQSPHFSRVERLCLGRNAFGPGAGEILAKSHFRHLRALDLQDQEKLTAKDINHLIKSNRLAQVEWLNLGHCNLPPGALVGLLGDACPRLARVKLTGNPGGESFCDALARGQLPDLRDLRLELVGDVAAKACSRLARSAWVPRLARLMIVDQGTLHSLAPELAHAPWECLEELHWLSFGEAAWSQPLDEAVDSLSRNSRLRKLRGLVLHVPLTERAVPSIARLTSLRLLMIPAELAKETAQLTAALPHCIIKKTAYVRER